MVARPGYVPIFIPRCADGKAAWMIPLKIDPGQPAFVGAGFKPALQSTNATATQSFLRRQESILRLLPREDDEAKPIFMIGGVGDNRHGRLVQKKSPGKPVVGATLVVARSPLRAHLHPSVCRRQGCMDDSSENNPRPISRRGDSRSPLRPLS